MFVLNESLKYKSSLTSEGDMLLPTTCSPIFTFVPLQNYGLVHAEGLPVHSGTAKSLNVKSEIVKDQPYLVIPEFPATFFLAAPSTWSAFSLVSLVKPSSS